MPSVEVNILDDAGPTHGPWKDIADDIQLPTAYVKRVAILNRGTSNGRPAVLLASQPEDSDSWYVTEITGDMWETIAGAIRGARQRWGVQDRP